MTHEGERVEAYRLNHNAAQAVEIIALTRACELTKGKRDTIYTNSKYAYREICRSRLRPYLG